MLGKKWENYVNNLKIALNRD